MQHAHSCMLCYRGGREKFLYSAEPTKDKLIAWMKEWVVIRFLDDSISLHSCLTVHIAHAVLSLLSSPQPPKPPEPESSWADEPSDVVHLTDADFYDFLDENPSALVMFYAPCKQQLPSVRDCDNIQVFLEYKRNAKLVIVCADTLLRHKCGACDPQLTTAVAVNVI